MTPPAGLFRLHRHHLSNVLIIGGSSEQRIHTAFSFHRHSLLRQGPFVCIDCEVDAQRLCAGLHAWLAAGNARAIENPIHAAARGTLFLDSIGSLSRDTQRLLHEFTCRQQDAVPPSGGRPWRGRLVVGHADALIPQVRSGRFDAGLYDALDKVTLDLGGHERTKRDRSWGLQAAGHRSASGVRG